MGRLHARVLSEMSSATLAGVFDDRPDAAGQAAADYQTKALASLDDVANVAKAAIVAVPTTHHLAIAAPLLRAGVACLIEKPLAGTVAQGQAIVDLSRQTGTPVMVGHIERFNPAVRAMRQHIGQAQFIEVDRVSPLTFRSIDVGVVMDVMIHDIDIVLNLAASPLVSVDAMGVNVVGDVEDLASVRLRFESGCVANLTASRLALKVERKLRVFSSDAYVSLDYQKKKGMLVRRRGQLESIREVVAKFRAGEITDASGVDFMSLVEVEPLTIDDAEPLRIELEHFVSAVRGEVPLEVTAEDGLRAVEVAARIVEAIGQRSV